MTTEMVQTRVEPFVRLLRERRADTPILLAESPLRPGNNPGNEALRAAYQNLLNEGIQGLHYLDGGELLGGRENGTVDGVHPTDLGFLRMARGYEPVLRRILDAHQPDERTSQEAWAQATQPGVAHERLERLTGKWQTVMKQWRGPGEPTVSYGIATYQTILRGRFVEEQLRMEMAGMPVEIRSLIGYDNIKQKYVASWASNMETHLINMEGVYDEAENTVTYTGRLVLPTGEELAVRSVEREIDDDTRITETYLTMPGDEERKNTEMTYTRVAE
jgi:hypothetical protein